MRVNLICVQLQASCITFTRNSTQFRAIPRNQAQKNPSCGLQGTLNARKRTKQIPYNLL